MSLPLNYAKLHRRDQVRRNYQPSFMATTKWLPIGFGENKGKTMPTLLFTDPQYLGEIVDGNIISTNTAYGRELNRQARVVCNRAGCILAGYRYGVKMQFVFIVDLNNVFERVVLTPKKGYAPIQLAEGSKIIKRSTKLAVSIVRDFDNPGRGYKRMVRSLRQMFITKNPEWTFVQQYDRFLENPDNFDLSGIKQDAYL